MPPVLHHSFSGPHRPPPALSSTPTSFHSFILQSLSVFVFSSSVLFVITRCSFLLLLYPECYRFERVLLPLSIFYLALLSHIWYMHCRNFFLSRLPWELVVQLQKQALYCAKQRPGPTACLNYKAIDKLNDQYKFYLNMTNIFN